MKYPVLKDVGIVICLVFVLKCLSVTNSANAAEIDDQQIIDQSDTAMSLDRAIRQTLTENPALRIFSVRDQVLIKDKQIADQKPAYHLEVELENVLGTGEAQFFDASDLSVSLSSVIELGEKRAARREIVSSRQAQLAFEKEITGLDLLTDLTLTYIDILTIQEQISLASESRELSDDLIKSIARRNRVGLVPDADLQRARIGSKEAELSLKTLQLQHEQLKQKLISFWGGEMIDFARVEGNLFQLGEVRELNALMFEIESRPDLARFVSENRLNQAELALAQAHSQADWEWSLGMRHFNASDDVAFLASINVQLGQSQRALPHLEKVRLQANEISLQEEQVRRRLRTQLQDFYSQRQQARLRIQSLRDEIIPMLEKVLRETQRGYYEGRYAYLDLISARQSLISARARLIISASQALKNVAHIERLTGVSLFSFSESAE